MQDWTPREHYTAEDLVEIIRILRDGENGCPWDKVQTHASIRKNFLEETCEALEAIDADDPVMMQEELGDVLMQVAFHAVIEEERGRFTFEGFLSVNKKSRRDHLEELKDEKRTMIFYEAPHKFINTIGDLHRVLGDREIAIVRELTKVHEQVVRTTLAQAEKDYTENKIKGEIVLIVAGKKAEPTDAITFDQAVEQARALVEKGASVNAAAKEIAAVTPYKKGDLYKALL